MFRALLAAILTGSLVSCASAPPPNALADDSIAAALDRLVKRSHEKFPFVIVQEKTSQKFVQFALDKGSIVIDLPFTTLTGAERPRAGKLFRELGISSPNNLSVEVLGRSQRTPLTSFQAGFGTDAKQAAVFAKRIFLEVYLFPASTSVSIDEANQERL